MTAPAKPDPLSVTADRTLAEIVAEGYALETAGRAQPQLSDLLAFSEVLTLFYAVHGPRLLAVAEAALVLRNAMGADWPLSLRDEMAAFDAAAGGRS